MFEPLLSTASFHFLSELQLRKSLCKSLLPYTTIIFSRPFIATVRILSAIYGQYPTKVRKRGGGGINQAEIHSPFFKYLFNANLTALQMSAKYARMLLFSV